MCGLIGVLAYGEFEDKKMEKVRQESMIYLATELLQITQARGKDATGIATMFSDCDYSGLKMGVSAQEFISRFGDDEEDYEGYVKSWRKKTKPAKMVIGHCRKPSVGGDATPDDNKNNHPIKIGDIIGVHNGTLTNHEKIFSNLNCERDGLVDSEAIFRLIHHFTINGTEPFTTQAIQETCKRLSGSYAVLSFSGNNPFQLAAFRDGRPLEIAIVRPLKLVLIASEKDFLKQVLFSYNKVSVLYQTVPSSKFLPLDKGDVELGTMDDDSLFLFDLRKEINDNTKIEELYITEKVPRTDKLWGDTKTVANKNQVNTWNSYNHNYNHNYNHSHYTEKKAEVAATNVPEVKNTATTTVQKTQISTYVENTKPKTTYEDRSCMAWNKKSMHYESVGGVFKSSVHGNVEIDCSDGSITDIDSILSKNTKTTPKDKYGHLMSEKAADIELDEVKTPIDNLVADPAKISESESAKYNKEEELVRTHYKDIPQFLCVDGDDQVDGLENLTEVDLDIYPEVLSAAIDATQKELKFSNDDELADAIEIADKEDMKSMSLHSLANRIKSFFFKKGWYSGYITKMREEQPSNEVDLDVLSRARNKNVAAQTTIRNMKTMTRVLCRILKQYPENSIQDYVISTALKEASVKGGEIDMNVIKKTFREKDLEDMGVLNRIIISVNGRETGNV